MNCDRKKTEWPPPKLVPKQPRLLRKGNFKSLLAFSFLPYWVASVRILLAYEKYVFFFKKFYLVLIRTKNFSTACPYAKEKKMKINFDFVYFIFIFLICNL